ncbi:MAG: hypothetical protein IKB01_01685 [Lachnospiraceae bacterium]|nr:hypothetical protein [Lachnospiraceae bacterium]
MKRIGIYFFCVVALGCVTSSILYRRSEEANEIRLEKSASETSEERLSESEMEDGFDETSSSDVQDEVIEVLDGKTSDERFLIKEEDGYLVIYDRVAMKRYDETTIQLYELPERLQELISDGLYFANEEELYAFLENYSS